MLEERSDHQRVRTIYYDSDDLRLTRWGGSLRFRSPDEWTLTLPPPSSDHLRYTTEHIFHGGRTTIPDRALDLATAYLRGATLQPVAGPPLPEPPDLIAPLLGPDARVETVVRAALIGSVRHLINVDVAMRIGGDSAGVHLARVAVRRLRSDLRTFRPVLDDAWTAGLRERLRWLGDALAAARDADVLLERLSRHAASLPDVDRERKELVLNLLRGIRAAAYRQLRAVLRTPRYALVLGDALEAVRRPPFNERAAARACDTAPAFLDDAWRTLHRAVRARSRPSTDEELHDIRIVAKRVRYAADALVPVCGQRAVRFAKRVAELQAVLGEHHDAIRSCEQLRHHLGGGDGAFVAGELIALERAGARRARRRWRAVWHDVCRDYQRFSGR